MAIGRFLNHQVSIVRMVGTLDDGDPVLDDHGQPVRSEDEIATGVAAGIQPKSAREVAAISQAGASIADHTIYLLPRIVTTADLIVHDPITCPVGQDLPPQSYRITTVPDAVGAGHHLELDARLVKGNQHSYATANGS